MLGFRCIALLAYVYPCSHAVSESTALWVQQGVFKREWTHSTITVDCNAYSTHIEMK
jgi:hypothetical protein